MTDSLAIFNTAANYPAVVCGFAVWVPITGTPAYSCGSVATPSTNLLPPSAASKGKALLFASKPGRLRRLFTTLICVFAAGFLPGCGTKSDDLSANAGADVLVNEGDPVQLDASATFGPTAATYSWQQASGPSVAWTRSGTAGIQFTAPDVTRRTDLTFEVTVNWGEESSRDRVVVTVNNAPLAVAGDSITVDELSNVLLDGGQSFDDDGSISSSVWTQISGPDVELDDPDALVTSFVAPDVVDTTALLFELTVTDDNGASSSATIEIQVLGGIFPVVIGDEVSFDLPADLSPTDLSNLPTGALGEPILIEGPRLGAVVELEDRDQIEGMARCLAVVKACTSPPDRTIDDCMRSAPVCTNSTWWQDDDACCPESCFGSYESQRLDGIGAAQAFLDTFFSSSSCIDAVRLQGGVL